ncbi:DinB family protein [Rhodohalobacter halophilus]|uniref:DinB family protein n=1 Tax=Rhodohalobacter halophilus TaxID=1812810 RepID=UPI00083F9E04|nr:DinB family protein [Rhodohalobacter halophilus]
MNQRQKLQWLFTYDLWCARKLLDHFTAHSPFRDEVACRAFLAHIVNIQEVWYNRVVETSVSEIEKWDEYNPKDLRRKARKLNRKWLDLIGDHEVDLSSEIHYYTEKMVKRSSVLEHICHHLIVHGEFHRAQISLFLRNCDIKPPKIDYTQYQSAR